MNRRIGMGFAAVVASVSMVVGGCSGSGQHAAAAGAGKPANESMHDPAAHAQGPMMKFASRLVGDWQSAGPDGAQRLALHTHRTAAGTAVCETMFPGSPHEMVNMYHLDGETLVMTHYCAAGNQPRLEATHTDGNSVELKMRDVTNRLSPDESYMGYLKITFVDDDHLVEEWKNYSGSKELGTVKFEYTRVKG